MKKYMYMAALFGMAGSSVLLAQDNVPTIFYGEAAAPDGGENISVVEQAENAQNPLGDPIVGPYVAPKAYNAADAIDNTEISSNQPQNNFELGDPMGKMNPNPAIDEIRQQQEFGRFVNYETEMMQ